MSAAKFTIIILMLVALSAAAHADLVINKYTNEFSATTPNNEQIKLCACGSKVDRILVENTGSFAADFHVEVLSQYQSIRIPNADFQLAPGNFQEVLIYIEDTCQAAGMYNYDVVVTNSYGRMQRITRTMRIDMCQNTALEVTPYNLTVGLCKPATYRVNITNVGTYADSFRLDFGPYNDVAQLPNRGVYLTPGESYAQDVSFVFACSEHGTKDIPIIVRTDKAGTGAETARQVTIINQFNFALDVPTDVSVCAQTTTRIPVTIRNSADAPEDLVLQSSNPAITVPADIHLEPLQEKNFTITFKPEQPGVQRFMITASDIYGGVQKQREITVTAGNCYAPAAEVRDTPTHTVTAPLESCCGEKTYFVNVRNDGDRTQAFNIRIDGPTFFVLDETTVRLEPSQNINVPLRATLPCSDQEYILRVFVTPVGHPEIEATAELRVNSQTQRACHMVQIDDDELTFEKGASALPVTVVHTGSAPGNYTITTNSTLFTIEERNISLQPGESAQIHMIPTANLSKQESGRYIVLPTFTLASRGIAYNEEIGIELRDAGTNPFAWISGIFAMSLCQWIILLLLLAIIIVAIILLAIYGGYAPFEEGLERATLTLLKSGLLILILLLLLAMLLLEPPTAEMRYERTAQATNGSVIEWYQDMQKVIDMQQYFYDPDQDLIKYTVTQPQDISADVDGTMLVLTPDQGFSGENTLIITASDQRGALTTSEPFTLRVIAERQLTFGQKVQMWCPYIVVLELIILLFLLFLIVLTIKEYRQSPHSSNVLVVVEKPTPARKTPAKKTTRRRRTATAATAATPRASPVRSARGTSRALVPLPVKGVIVDRAPSARGRQVEMSRGAVVREFKAGGNTVNIAVGTPAAPAPTQVVVPGAKTSEVVYVGAKNGNTVHTPQCMVARRIPRHKRVAYNSKREAVGAGLVPCKVCRPFEGGM